MKDSYQYSLDDLDEAPSKKTKEFLDAIDDLRNGKKNSEERLYDFVKNGRISVESYNELIKKYSALHKKKVYAMQDKTLKISIIICAVARVFRFIALCIVITLLFVFLDDEISNSYQTGYYNGYNSGESDGYNDGYSDGYKYYSDVKNEYNYLHKYAVIVTTTGKKYHHYGCYHIKDSSVYIYNIELAESKGYTPCLDCH